MMSLNDSREEAAKLSAVQPPEWGEHSENNFGYASNEDRLAMRGLEDWELTETISESQRGVPYWFVGVTVAVLLISVGLGFPFWGLRPGDERPWVDWGFGIALVYVALGSVFLYFMVNLYGSKFGGRLDADKEKKPASEPRRE
jgi:hypothetical protein